MSDSVYPGADQLPGWSYARGKTPMWNTVKQRSASGREVRVGLQSYPIYKFDLLYEMLRSDADIAELQLIMDFFNARNGALDNFLYNDPTDNSVTDSLFGTGDGATTQFQLTRAVKATGFLEPVMNVNALANIKKSGVTQSNPANYTISSTGLVTFAAPPAGAAPLTWSGTYYFRCRFEQDMNEFEEFAYRLWTLSSVAIIGSLGLKI